MDAFADIFVNHCLLVCLAILFGLAATAGYLGAMIQSGIEWGNIRYDYSDPENHNPDALTLYYLSMVCWILPLVIFVVGIVRRFIKNAVVQRIFSYLALILSLGFIAVISASIEFSKKSRCETIRTITTAHGQQSQGWKDFIQSKTGSMNEEAAQKWYNDFDHDRCEGHNTNMIVFLSLFLGGTLIVIIIVIIINWATIQSIFLLQKMVKEEAKNRV